ncbi:unnamed protein product, partial [Iphiclides podalirius]
MPGRDWRSSSDQCGAIRGEQTTYSGHNGDANNRDYGKVDVGRPGFVQLTANDDTARAQRRGARNSAISHDPVQYKQPQRNSRNTE